MAKLTVGTAPMRMIPWQKVLAAALNDHEVIWCASYGDRPPWSRADPRPDHGCPRAAHRLVAADLARAMHVPVRLGDAARQVNHLVLVRVGATAGHDQVLDAATCKPPAPDQPARTLELSLTALGTVARNLDPDQLSAAQAGHLAAIFGRLRLPISLGSRRLERRAKRR